jgi:hypothetical protein
LGFSKICGKRLRGSMALLTAIMSLGFATGTSSAAQIITSAEAQASTNSENKDIPRGGRIHGSVKAGTVPLSGVIVAATNRQSGKKVVTITDGAGMYSFVVSQDSRYLVLAEFPDLTSSAKAPIVNPYFQLADQMRQDFEDGHQLKGPTMQPNSGSTVTSEAASPGTNSSGNSTSSGYGRLHGEIFWNGGNSALNAQPFLLAGQPAPNPSYYSNSYGITLGGPLFLPERQRFLPSQLLRATVYIFNRSVRSCADQPRA